MAFSYKLLFPGIISTLIISHSYASPEQPTQETFSLNADTQSVSWGTNKDGLSENHIAADGNVKVKTNELELTADKILAIISEGVLRQVEAENGVDLITGSEELHCDSLNAAMSQDGKILKGSLKKVSGKAGQLLVFADGAELNSNTLRLKDGSATVCSLPNPHFALKASSMTINTLTRRVTARNVALQIQRRTLISLPYISTSLKGDKQSSFMPAINYSSGKGLGIRYPVVMPINNGMLVGSISAFEYQQPEILFSYDERIDSRGDNEPLRRLQEGGYPEAAFMPLINGSEPQKQASWFVSAVQNRPINVYDGDQNTIRVNYLDVGARYDTPLEHVGSLQSELRVGSIREEPRMSDSGRGSMQIRWISPSYKVAPLVDLHVGSEVRTIAYGSGESLNRITGQVMLEANPLSWVKYNLGYASAEETGNSPFSFDNIWVKREGISRLVIGKGTSLDVSGFWDFDRDEWYDVKVALKIRAHCIEPQISWSKKDRSVEFGMNIAQ